MHKKTREKQSEREKKTSLSPEKVIALIIGTVFLL